MSAGQDAIDAAIARGDKTAALLNAHRDALIYHMTALRMVVGSDEGLRACTLGATEAVVIAAERQRQSWHARNGAGPA